MIFIKPGSEKGYSVNCIKKILPLILTFIAIIPSYMNAQENNSFRTVDMLMLKEDYSSAASQLEKMAATDSLNPQVFYRLGISRQKLNQYRNAVTAFRKSADLDKNNSDALLALAGCYRELGQDIAAAGLYSQALKNDSSDVFAGLKLGSTLIDLQNYNDAVKVFRHILVRDSMNGFIYRQLGNCYENLSSGPDDTLQIAIDCHKKAFLLNGDDMIALQHYIKDLLYAKKTGEALDFILEASASRLNDPVVNKLAGDIYFNLDRYADAISYYSKAVKYGDSSAYVFQKLGVSHYNRAGKLDSSKTKFLSYHYSEAVKMLSKSMDKDYNPVTIYFLAKAYNKTGEYKKAAELLTSSVSLIIPGLMYDIYLSLAENYLAMKDYKNTIEAYKSVLHFNPGKTEMLAKIAELYDSALQDKKMALRYYSDYLDSVSSVKKTNDMNSGNKDDVQYVNVMNRIKKLEQELKH